MSNKPNVWRSSFWSSPWAWFSAFVVAWMTLPLDELFSKNVIPAGSNLSKRAQLALIKGKEAIVSLASKLNKLSKAMFWFTVFFGAVDLSLFFYGLHSHNHVLVAISGLAWAIYGLVGFLILRAALAVLSKIAEASTNLPLNIAESFLSKISLLHREEKTVFVSLDTKDFFSKFFVVVAGIPSAIFFVAHIPSWEGLGFLLICALGAISSGCISAHIGDKTIDGWRLVKKVIFILVVIDALLAFVRFFLPLSLGSRSIHGFDLWLMDPTWGLGWFDSCIAVVGIFTVLAVVIHFTGGDKAKKVLSHLPTAAIITIAIVFLRMGPLSHWFVGETDNNAGDDVSETSKPAKTASKTNSVKTAPPDYPKFQGVAPSSGVQLPAPDVPYVHKSKKASKKKSPSKSASTEVIFKAPSFVNKHTPKTGDGYDRATALLDEVGL